MRLMGAHANSDPLALFHPAVRAWFQASFDAPTRPQQLGWPSIASGQSTLILAPTGSGKTLTAFLSCLDRLMFTAAPPDRKRRCRVLYVSPLKALAVDVERNLRAPLAGIARVATERGDPFLRPEVSIRTGDTPSAERVRFQRQPSDILITTPESLYLLLTSNARDALRSVETIIIDEIHALVPTKRGAHLAISLERLAARCEHPPQRVGLSATQRPLDEVARFLGGAAVAHAATPAASRPGKRRASTATARRTRREAVGSTAAVRQATDEVNQEFSISTGPVQYRPVSIVDAGARKLLKLKIEVPVEDMARLPGTPRRPQASIPGEHAPTVTPGDTVPTADEDASADIPSGPASAGVERPSIWAAIHPRLLELIRSHRSTLIFVNSRRLAERLAGALNELAGEVLVRSHHGSIAREQRMEIEDRLKAGTLRALVATSSLELGIDMGAIDLVVQVEAPPSVASGLQRIGRGGHQIGAISEGIIFPKFRGDLVACAAVTKAMHDGAVEATRYPRNPLDIVAQQIVAMTAMDEWTVDDLFDTLRGAAPCAELSRGVFEGVLDMLSGRYPSDEFAELRPRITWDRIAGTAVAREGAKRIAIANGGTIPDRGLYGVFLAGAPPGTARVGELDEEMVFETQVGETFVLGASTWRVDDITHDKVLVTPAPGEPGKTPFWKGDRAGRPLELGLAIGRLVRDLLRMPAPAAIERLTREHDLSTGAAENLIQYLRDQQAATRTVPDASAVVIERVRDELGDWRVCVLSPRGGRVHAPWAMAAAARIRDTTGIDVETLWGDDGFVVRFPDVEAPPDSSLLLPDPEEARDLVVRQLGATALFAAKFRENAGRSLLLPKRRPGMRVPLWQQRKRAADLLAVASRFGSFPVLLETYRECLRDHFDMPALIDTLADLRSRRIRTVTVDSDKPSPFAASLLFSYVANYLYDGDAPLAERRAQALAVDQAQLRELMGDAELRELLDAEAMHDVEQQLQRLDPRNRAKHADAVHDMLIGLGDLTLDEIGDRVTGIDAAVTTESLVRARRILQVRIDRDARFIAVEDAARYRDSLGVPIPTGVPESLLVPVADPLGDLALRYARTHAPFTAAGFAGRYGLGQAIAHDVLLRLTREGRLLEGEFRPGGTEREWTHQDVLRVIRRRSLAKLRREVEPVEPAALCRFTLAWHGATTRRSGADALLDVVEQLQGAPLPASVLESEILPARLEHYDPGDLDAVVAAGEVVWVGVEPLGERDGRVALFLTDQLALLLPQPSNGGELKDLSERERTIIAFLQETGASFFGAVHEAAGGGYPGETVNALWNLVWRSVVTNDALHPLRAFTRARLAARRRGNRAPTAFRSRRLVPPSAEGRWTLVHSGPASAPAARRVHAEPSGAATTRSSGAIGSRRVSTADAARKTTAWANATAQQLLARHGLVTRESLNAESSPGGFSPIYSVLKAMEEHGRVRRGYFVAGLGATQFALPGALDLLRSYRDGTEAATAVLLSATDPANPYGATLRWPAQRTADEREQASTGRGPTRTVGASVVVLDGALIGYLGRGDRHLLTWIPAAEPGRTRAVRALAQVLIQRARSGDDTPRGMLIEEIDGSPAALHPFRAEFVEAGFIVGALGLQATRPRP